MPGYPVGSLSAAQRFISRKPFFFCIHGEAPGDRASIIATPEPTPDGSGRRKSLSLFYAQAAKRCEHPLCRTRLGAAPTGSVVPEVGPACLVFYTIIPPPQE